MGTTPLVPKRPQARLAWVGVGFGVACMVALIVFGAVTSHPQVVVIAGSAIAAMVGVAASVQATVDRGTQSGPR